MLTLLLAPVNPVYKANEKELFSNYRPMSVLPCFSKILEKLMYERVLNFLNKHKILTDSQYGLRKKNLAILEFVSKICKAVDNSEYTMGVFPVLSKVFDTLDHNILLYKLEHYGFRGIALDWFRDYLSGRKKMLNSNQPAQIT